MKGIYAAVVIAFLVSSAVAQEKQYFGHQDVSRDSLLTLARSIIESAQLATFITVDEHAKPQARTMSAFPPEEDMTIWFGTSPRSRKVQQVKNNSNTMVFYYDPKGLSYVSVSGKARIVNDPDKKVHYWKDGWTKYYPDPDKDYILIEVTPERLEIVSYKHDLFWDSKGKPHFIEF